MAESKWIVLQNYNSKRNYGIKITPRVARTLAMLKAGNIFVPKDFVKEHYKDDGWLKIKTQSNAKNTIYLAAPIGQKIGMLELASSDRNALSFDEFLAIPEINDCIQEINPMRLKNTKQTKYQGTRGRYGYTLHKFNNWLTGQTFEFEFQMADNVFKRESRKIKLDNVISLLNLLKKLYPNDLKFKEICKKYLRDPIHDSKGSGAMKNEVNGIKSFFTYHEVPLNFNFNVKSGHKVPDGEDEQKLMTLDDYMKFMTKGKPTITEKTVFSSKLHRGLDNQTYSDRFNYNVWPQLVKYFGQEDYHSWDLSMCPVPIVLVRVKTGYKHRGFLDRDAVEDIQDYLDLRDERTGSPMRAGLPLVLNQFGKPITEGWIYDHYCTIADRAKLRHLRDGYTNSYNMDAHEIRDLLKSLAKDCKVDRDAADHFIGHMPKDSYEKESIMFPETLRKEYQKMSKRLNIFSKFSSIVNGIDDSDILKAELNDALAKLKQNEYEEQGRESALARHELILKQQQQEAQENKRKLEELQEQLSQINQNHSKSTEFCCANCNIIHNKDQCPNCGSKIRRIFDSKAMT